MRIALLSLFTLGCLGATASVIGAPNGARERVSALLSSVPSANAAPEVLTARREAQNALKRGDKARTTAEEIEPAVADLLDETALEWAELAKELEELNTLQQKAESTETQLAELDAQVKREKAHLEETEARRGRAQATLNKVVNTRTAPSPTAPSPAAPSPAAPSPGGSP